MSDTFDFSQAKRGPIVDPKGKTRITIMLDDDVLQAFRERAQAESKGYQTMINEALRNALKAKQEPEIAVVLQLLTESFTTEKMLRARENAVFVNTIEDASNAFDEALHAVERLVDQKVGFPQPDLECLRRAVSTVDFVKSLLEAKRPKIESAPTT